MRHVLVAAFLLAACSDPSIAPSEDLATSVDLGSSVDLVPAGDAAVAPIEATAGQWTWVPILDAVCSDGSPTGIAVNPGTSDKLYVYFEGGGGCGDYSTCFQLRTATSGPFGEAQMKIMLSGYAPKTFDRTEAKNPFATDTLVYVPYCTGDLHGGIRTVDYTNGTDTKTYHHMGHINALRALDRLQVSWPSPSRLVISGSSAGGYGALNNFADARLRWPSAKSYLVDDSGPPLKSGANSPLLAPWFGNWGLFDWSRALCPGCEKDPTSLLGTLATRYPDDRMALLSSLQDETIRGFYLLPPEDFEAELRMMATDTITPLPRFHYFFVSGQSHTMLGNPARYSSQGTDLWTWLGQMVGDDAAWANTTP
jgi:hypothetical protein